MRGAREGLRARGAGLGSFRNARGGAAARYDGRIALDAPVARETAQALTTFSIAPASFTSRADRPPASCVESVISTRFQTLNHSG